MEQADPLAALEAEYAVVLAQTRTIAASACSSQPTSDAESAGSESDDEEGAAVGGFESYALLPSSPCNSDDEMTADNEDAVNREKDAEERPQSETKKQEASTQQKDVGGLEEDKRRTIMQSMQQVKLRSPPWAAAANLTDDELVALVQKQLGLKDKST
ncbi:hypothetical protein KRP22_006500 [Phytophthora ramorum]|uniref:uncharacterized protein n=1 Tax=Phytophthora ramorum TaxID=164328 RepID=UPI0030B697DF|nr:hypothetical protein KRP23_4400 [Phytophthora ramorum]KAH7507267.1 hypothetical protein KRP22_2370 [Phytophthora ramorum]